MTNTLQKKLYENGYLIVKNILNYRRDLKPVLNDMEFVMDCLIQKYAKKTEVKKVLNLNFKRKYSYISKLNIYDLDQYFNTRLPRDHVKRDSDYFATQSLWNLITNKRILDVVEKILGKEIMSNPVQNTRIKQPEKKLPRGSINDGLSGRTPWHQDAAVLNSRGQKLTDMVTVWIPFTKTTKKNGCMITVKKINKMGLLNHVSGYRGQVELKNSKLLDDMEHIYLEANVGDIILLHKHSIHCSLPNRSNDFRISADLRYNVAGQPSGRSHFQTFMLEVKIKTILKFKILNNGYLFGRMLKKDVSENMHLSILCQRTRIIKETCLI